MLRRIGARRHWSRVAADYDMALSTFARF